MYYIEKDNNIVLYDEDRQRLENTLKFMPQYAEAEIQETSENETILNCEIVSSKQASDCKLAQAKEVKLAEALEKAYEYENKTGYITFDGRPVNMQDEQDLDPSLSADADISPPLPAIGGAGERNTMKLSVELFNQSKFFQMVIGFAQGLITEDFVYSTKEDVNVYINALEAQEIYLKITEALSRLWTLDYARYKELINAAESLETLSAIVIDYKEEGNDMQKDSEVINGL